MEAAENFLATFRWEEALDVTDEKDQEAQQQGDLDDVIDKELQAPNPAIGCIETKRSKQSPH